MLALPIPDENIGFFSRVQERLSCIFRLMAALQDIEADAPGFSISTAGIDRPLGLERMLSPRREAPLPHAMTTYLNTDEEKRVEVIESSVSLEIANGDGQVITVNRAVKASTDTRLITVDFGAALSEETAALRRQTFSCWILAPHSEKMAFITFGRASWDGICRKFADTTPQR